VEQTSSHVVLEPDPEGGYVAVVPGLPGCYSQGETAEEALSNAHEAIALSIEDMCERGAIPDLARKLIRVAMAAEPNSAALDYTENAPGPDEFATEGEPLDWEGEGWS
jgi:predicted RNase H-like HicB family nuclease